MSNNERLTTREHAPLLEALDRIAKLLALLVAQGKTKREAILRLADVGFRPRDIAELLGTTGNTVRVTLHQAKKSARPSTPGRSG